MNLPPVDPMSVNQVIVEQPGGTNSFNLKSSFKNAVIYGLSTSVLQRSAIRFNKFALKSDAYTDRLDFSGQYTMNGQILVLPIRGEGFANVSMQGLTTRHELHGNYFTGSDNNNYINVTSYKIKFNPKAVIFRFDNLFNDKRLSDAMNKFMNDNWEPVFAGMIPGYEVEFGKKFMTTANLLFHQVPVDLIFLK